MEHREDAQLAREVEVGLPIELNKDQRVALLRDYLRDTFVSQGMVADVALHTDNPANRHAHVLLTMRDVTPAGFGAKRREWNDPAKLLSWREAWARTVNEHLARVGVDTRVDHWTNEARGIDLPPSRKVGPTVHRQN